MDTTVTAKVVDGAAASSPKHARGMRIINHHDAVILLSKFAEFRQWRDVTIHRENAVGDQQRVAVPADRFLKDTFAVLGVSLLENLDRSLRETATVYDRGVVQLVGDDEILLAEDGRDRARVGSEAGLEHDTSFDVLEAGDLLLKLH